MDRFVDLTESEGACYKDPGNICEVLKADAVCSQEGEDDDDDAVLSFNRKKRNAPQPDGSDVISFNFTFKLDPLFHKDDHSCDDLLCREKYDTLLEVRLLMITHAMCLLISGE